VPSNCDADDGQLFIQNLAQLEVEVARPQRRVCSSGSVTRSRRLQPQAPSQAVTARHCQSLGCGKSLQRLLHTKGLRLPLAVRNFGWATASGSLEGSQPVAQGGTVTRWHCQCGTQSGSEPLSLRLASSHPSPGCWCRRQCSFSSANPSTPC